VPHVLITAGAWAQGDGERNARQIEPHDDARDGAGGTSLLSIAVGMPVTGHPRTEPDVRD